MDTIVCPSNSIWDQTIASPDWAFLRTEITHQDIQPNWKKMHSRLSVPCRRTKLYAWLRTGFAITLGELFQKLHHMYTAKEIYYLYLHLDVVAVKKKKNLLQSKKRPFNQSSIY
jgi:hypothetical protein